VVATEEPADTAGSSLSHRLPDATGVY